MALEKLRAAKGVDWSRDSTMLTDAAHDWQSIAPADSLPKSGKPSIGHYIRKIFLVSGNDAFNRIHGFLSDHAHIVDLKNGLEFMVAAVIHVNANGVSGDNLYEDEGIGLRFLRNLGKAVYEHERHRKREHAPNLSGFDELFDGKLD